MKKRIFTRKELYDRILDVSKRQSKCLDKEDFPAFDDLINIRQGMLDKLVALVNQPNFNEPDYPELRKEMRELHAQNIARYEELQEDVKDKLRGERQKKNIGGKYANAYGGYGYQEGGMFFDKRHSQ